MPSARASQRVRPVFTEDQRDIVVYIAQMSHELASMAKRLGLADLSNSLKRANEDAQIVVAGHDLVT